jgi:RNAse (barnase) inhibitor barstar
MDVANLAPFTQNPSYTHTQAATALRAAGYDVRLVGLGACADRAAIYTVLAQVLAFPSYFGRNLDALNDCMRERVAAKTAILFTGLTDGGVKGVLSDVAEEAAEEGDVSGFHIITWSS